MDSNILKEFLVSLGYKVNEASQRNFVASLAKITAATQVAAAGVVAGVAKMAQALDGLYWASQRAQASTDNLEAFGYQISQMGGSADAAKASVEQLGMAMRFNPGTQGLLRAMGIQATDAAQAMEQLGTKFRAMQPAVARAYARNFGIDDRMLFSLMQGDGGFGEDYRKKLSAAGLSMETAAQKGRDFSRSLRSLGADFQIVRTLSAEALMKGIGVDVRKLDELIVKHFREIADVVAKAGKIIVGVGEAIWRMMWRLEQLWNGLDSTEKQIVMAFAGIITAWRLMNLAFLKSPLGIILLLAAAIALLYDDYQTWKSGGDSLIDWGKWEPAIKAAIEGVKKIIGIIGDLAARLGMDGGVTGAFELLAAFVAGAWATKMLVGLGRVSAGLSAGILGKLGLIGAALAALYLGFHIGGLNEHEQEDLKKLGLAQPGVTSGSLPLGTEGTPTRGFKNWWGRNAPEALGGWTPDRLQMENNKKQAYDFWIQKGLTPAQSAGMVANEERESSFNPGDVGDGGQARGIYQWHPDRRAAILRGTGIDVATERDHQKQLEAAYWELTQGGEQSAWKRIQQAPDATSAAEQASKYYLRPADREGEAMRRGALANRLDQLRRQVGTQALGNSSGLLSPAPIAPGAGAATGGAATGGNATISQNTTINVTGSGDPQQVANLVTSGQARVNEGLVRGARGAVAVQ